MDIYSQKNSAWSGMLLGQTDLTCFHFGCYATSIAQLLTVAGYEVTPGDLITKLNSINGFTADGLVIHAKVEEAYPQLHYGGSGYQLIEGTFPKLFHWVSKANETIYDPWFGQVGFPAGFTPNGVVQNIGIDPLPKPVNVNFFGIVNANLLNARTQPSLLASIVKQVGNGTLIEFLDTVDGDVVGDNGKWFKRAEEGLYMWSGGITLK